MKHSLNKHIVEPMLFGIIASWLLVGAGAVVAVALLCPCVLVVALIGIAALLLVVLVPALRVSATAYSLAFFYHKADYRYNIGNGVAPPRARKQYEKKARRAASGCLKRWLVLTPFNPLVIAFLALLLAGGAVVPSLALVLFIAVVVLVAVKLAVLIMLITARRYCFDKYGNLLYDLIEENEHLPREYMFRPSGYKRQ